VERGDELRRVWSRGSATRHSKDIDSNGSSLFVHLAGARAKQTSSVGDKRDKLKRSDLQPNMARIRLFTHYYFSTQLPHPRGKPSDPTATFALHFTREHPRPPFRPSRRTSPSAPTSPTPLLTSNHLLPVPRPCSPLSSFFSPPFILRRRLGSPPRPRRKMRSLFARRVRCFREGDKGLGIGGYEGSVAAALSVEGGGEEVAEGRARFGDGWRRRSGLRRGLGRGQDCGSASNILP
jgi:hypothetical protein